MPSGQLPDLTQARSDGQAEIRDAFRLYEQAAASPTRNTQLRSKAEFEAMFASVTLREPGVVAAPLWHPEIGVAEPIDPTTVPDDHQLRSDGAAEVRKFANGYAKNAASPSRHNQLRTTEEFTAQFADLTLQEPGVVVAPRWRPEIGTAEPVDPAEVRDDHPILAGMGRKG